MTTKIIHFSVHGKLERAQFTDDDDPDDVRELFRSAASATRRDVIKLYSTSGALVSISPRLPSNSMDQPYRLEIVACCLRYGSKFVSEGGKNSLTDLEARLVALEEQVCRRFDNESNNSKPQWLSPILDQVDDLRRKLQKLEQSGCCSSGGTTAESRVPSSSSARIGEPLSGGSSSPRLGGRRRFVENTAHTVVWQEFQQLCSSEVSPSLMTSLRDPCFNNWHWSDPELLLLLRQMFVDLQLNTQFGIEMTVIEKWLFEVYKNYNDVPFHNFKHAFTVAQMMFSLIHMGNIRSWLDSLDLLSLIFSAICHDLDHPGFNNAYHVNAQTPLALMYNDISPLENHHCRIAFELVSSPATNIFVGLTPSQKKILRNNSIQCILATDMAKHNDIVTEFRQALPTYDSNNARHRLLLQLVLIKVSDISNEVRPPSVAELWLECLLEEFFRQSDTEKLEGLPVAPFMDRDLVTKANSQCGFIKFVILPLFEPLAELIPAFQDPIVRPVQSQLDHYETLKSSNEAATTLSTNKNGVTSSSGGSRKSSTGSMVDRPVADKS